MRGGAFAMPANHSPRSRVEYGEEHASAAGREDHMNEARMTQTTGGSLCLFDERGGLIGTIERPVQRDPLGPGRATVYLARPTQTGARPKVAA
jgi:hypothetical protein